MTRRIHCTTCGTARFIPMHPEDAAMGFRQRVKHLTARCPAGHGITITSGATVKTESLSTLRCDSCGQPIADGQPCVAITMWRGQEPPLWETDYGTPA
jgi:DNA-directed RNA polymerase subunit RPC12/RpoP